MVQSISYPICPLEDLVPFLTKHDKARIIIGSIDLTLTVLENKVDYIARFLYGIDENSECVRNGFFKKATITCITKNRETLVEARKIRELLVDRLLVNAVYIDCRDIPGELVFESYGKSHI